MVSLLRRGKISHKKCEGEEERRGVCVCVSRDNKRDIDIKAVSS
jgi:hypothetical protein